MKKWVGILLVLALLCTGAAAQENEVVALPNVAPLLQVEVVAGADYTSALVKEYYAAASYGLDGEDYQAPHMTAEERERAAGLLEAYQNGERPEQNVLNKLENVTVGVYTLNPEDYEGETLYTLLPIDPLTDEQILEVIDAFAQCGRTFDPDALSYRNCARGGGIETTRFFRKEENNRRDIATDLYIRQGFTSEAAFTPIVSDDGLGWVTLNAEAYCGLDSFMFKPYRPMTDDELLSFVIYTETGDPTKYGKYAEYEKQLRLELARLLNAPLVMERMNEDTCEMGDCNVCYGDEKVYYASFLTTDGIQYGGYLDIDTHKVLSAHQYRPYTLQYSDLYLDPFDEAWLTVATEAVGQLRGDCMEILTAESRGETDVQDAGYGVLVDVIMEDGSHYSIKIAYQTGAVCGWVSYDTTALDPDLLYTMMYE